MSEHGLCVAGDSQGGEVCACGAAWPCTGAGDYVAPAPGHCSSIAGNFYCTLLDAHEGPHQAWSCTCTPSGTCDEPLSLVESW